MKDIILKALFWGAAMMIGLAALDLLRGDAINWFIVIAGGVVFFGFKLVLGTAEARRAKNAKNTEKDNW